MARVRYVDKESASPEVADVFRKLEGNGARIINLHRTLGHSEAVFLPFLKMGNSLMTKAKLDARLRELAILRVALLRDARYEWQQHVVLARELGVKAEQVDGLPNWEASDAFDGREKAVLAYVDEVANNVGVADDVFARLSGFLSETEVVELTLSIGYWDMVARFLEALQVDLEEGGGTTTKDLLGGRK